MISKIGWSMLAVRIRLKIHYQYGMFDASYWFISLLLFKQHLVAAKSLLLIVTECEIILTDVQC